MSSGDFDTQKLTELKTKSTLKQPSNTAGWNLNQLVKGLRLIMDYRGNVLGWPVIITDPSQTSLQPAAVGVPAATSAGSNSGLAVFSQNQIYNGTNWDYLLSNQTLLSASDTTTTTFTGGDIATLNAKALLVTIDCTALTGTSYVPELQWKDGAGNYPSFWKQLTAKTAVARTQLVIGLGVGSVTGSVGVTTSDVGIAGTDSATASQRIIIPYPIPPVVRIVITKTAVTAFTANLQIQMDGP